MGRAPGAAQVEPVDVDVHASRRLSDDEQDHGASLPIGADAGWGFSPQKVRRTAVSRPHSPTIVNSKRAGQILFPTILNSHQYPPEGPPKAGVARSNRAEGTMCFRSSQACEVRFVASFRSILSLTRPRVVPVGLADPVPGGSVSVGTDVPGGRAPQVVGSPPWPVFDQCKRATASKAKDGFQVVLEGLHQRSAAWLSTTRACRTRSRCAGPRSQTGCRS